ncbi:hypothetical protein PHYPO_G00178760 [Pangasianodon hypophthalmus]|uniref:Uncharacterized protein n=1 Tax=Pangasianodon hypophthalmus TaxID=310915 RepID=A0A5N5PRX1_PANHP|nr:hypothetical protein PHYPO_G00178760 [Pangasianodon hypophthalmus]
MNRVKNQNRKKHKKHRNPVCAYVFILLVKKTSLSLTYTTRDELLQGQPEQKSERSHTPGAKQTRAALTERRSAQLPSQQTVSG